MSSHNINNVHSSKNLLWIHQLHYWNKNTCSIMLQWIKHTLNLPDPFFFGKCFGMFWPCVGCFSFFLQWSVIPVDLPSVARSTIPELCRALRVLFEQTTTPVRQMLFTAGSLGICHEHAGKPEGTHAPTMKIMKTLYMQFPILNYKYIIIIYIYILPQALGMLLCLRTNNSIPPTWSIIFSGLYPWLSTNIYGEESRCHWWIIDL